MNKKEINKMKFRDEIAKEIESIESKLEELESRLDFVFNNFSPEEDGAMESAMYLAEQIFRLDEKQKNLKETFWKLV